MHATQYIVTGAFGLSGGRIARRLLARADAGAGGRVRVETLTNTRPGPDGAALAGRVRAHPLDFSNPDALARALDGADALFNTYWVRFDHKRRFTHEQAVRNTFALFDAARRAGVRRIVHVSITNADARSGLPYFRGKGRIEEYLRASGVAHSILRPAVLFGDNAILLNNIAWMLRRFPVFGIFGDGEYKLEPVLADDLAALAVAHASHAEASVTLDAKGPESYAYRDLVRAIGRAIGCERRLVRVSPRFGYAAGRFFGTLKGDVVITREEIRGLMAGLLATDSPPTAPTRLSAWLAGNGRTLGRVYANELARR